VRPKQWDNEVEEGVQVFFYSRNADVCVVYRFQAAGFKDAVEYTEFRNISAGEVHC
jgi:hypothetical protein